MEIRYLWVDRIIKAQDFVVGETTDLEKIYYNLEQMGDYGKQLEQAINIKLLVVEETTDAIFSEGSFVGIVTFEKDESKARMQLLDSRWGTESYWQYMAEQMYPDGAVEFMRFYRASLLLPPSVELITVRPR